MELQIQDLISSIKKDGIEAAEAEAAKIIAGANEQSARIIANANAEAARIIQNAQNELEIMKSSARTNAEHAKRDAVLSFKASVQKEFEKLLASDTAAAVRGETLAKLILAVLGEENPADYAAEVAEVTEALKSELAQKIRNGLEIRVSPDVKRGFRLAAKDQSGYFDCSEDEITEMLMSYFPELHI